MQSFTSFQKILQGVARRQGFDMKLWEYRLQARWPEVVGEVLAAHTSPSRIKFRKLYVTVENSMWLHQLTFLKGAVLEKIRSETGQDFLSDIVFRVGEFTALPTTTSLETTVHHRVSAETMMAATECSRIIENQDLRNTFTRVIAKAFSAH